MSKILLTADVHIFDYTTHCPSNRFRLYQTRIVAQNIIKAAKEEGCEYLVLAGDIGVMGTKSTTDHPFWDWASENYKEVIVAMGNHEFYNDYDLSSMKDGFVHEIRKNVHYYFNCVVTIENVDFIISTLWTEVGKKNADMIRMKVNDYNKIKYGDHIVTIDDMNKVHLNCLNFIKKSLKESKSKYKVVVTHHVPSKKLIIPEFKKSNIKEAFMVDLTSFIKKSGANYWIYGHSHRNIDHVIGKTNCVCNQFGYTFTNEHTQFKQDKFFTLE